MTDSIPYSLGVDPGTISGWGLVDPAGQPVARGQTGTRNHGTTVEDIRAVIEEHCAHRPLCVAVEGQFLRNAAGRGGADRAKAISTLATARIAGWWEGAAVALGATLFCDGGISPNTWRAAVWGGRWTSEQAKVHAVRMAAFAWDIQILKTHHHTAEALWIASYAHGELVASTQVSLGLKE